MIKKDSSALLNTLDNNSLKLILRSLQGVDHYQRILTLFNLPIDDSYQLNLIDAATGNSLSGMIEAMRNNFEDFRKNFRNSDFEEMKKSFFDPYEALNKSSHLAEFEVDDLDQFL